MHAKQSEQDSAIVAHVGSFVLRSDCSAEGRDFVNAQMIRRYGVAFDYDVDGTLVCVDAREKIHATVSWRFHHAERPAFTEPPGIAWRDYGVDPSCTIELCRMGSIGAIQPLLWTLSWACMLQRRAGMRHVLMSARNDLAVFLKRRLGVDLRVVNESVTHAPLPALADYFRDHPQMVAAFELADPAVDRCLEKSTRFLERHEYE